MTGKSIFLEEWGRDVPINPPREGSLPVYRTDPARSSMLNAWLVITQPIDQGKNTIFAPETVRKLNIHPGAIFLILFYNRVSLTPFLFVCLFVLLITNAFIVKLEIFKRWIKNLTSPPRTDSTIFFTQQVALILLRP